MAMPQTPQVPELERSHSPAEPPVYRIDLSDSPRVRYRDICLDYAEPLQALTRLYDFVLSLTPFPRVLKYMAKNILRRVYSKEETEEICGIAEITGIPKHLIVAYNTFLDLFSGCVSGGARVGDAGGKRDQNGIIHFRGLDWGMDPLRKLIICIEYIREGKVVARSVTYAGYVGVLTGVREGLSMSFNYRPVVDSPTSPARSNFHKVLLLLGVRQSMPSYLRHILLSPNPPDLTQLTESVPKFPSSPCFLTFCSPDAVLLLEKDLDSAKLENSDTFLAVTNHDKEVDTWTTERWDLALRKYNPATNGMACFLENSVLRKQCVTRMWTASNSRLLQVDNVRKWLRTPPVVNECTHFSCIMDPAAEGGGLLWIKSYEKGVDIWC